MSKIAEDLCAEIRSQCEQAEHFKGLWLQANDELEAARTREAWLKVELNEAREEIRVFAQYPKTREDETSVQSLRLRANDYLKKKGSA